MNKETFKHKYIVNNETQCWEWCGAMNPAGYGNVRYKDEYTSSHRLSYILHYGDIKNKLWVLHKCDNRKCVNPEHLFLGTAKDNTQDMIKKNRQPDFETLCKNRSSGEKNGRSKLTLEMVRKIRILCKEKTLSLPEIGRLFDITKNTIWAIKHNKIWKHFK